MSTIRDRRKHQNRVDAIAEALDLNHNTTTNAPHAFASVGVSSADNGIDSEGLSDDHAHTQAKDDSTNQHLDLHQGADGQTFCSGCNEIKDIFDFEQGIRVKSWRTLDLLARVDRVRLEHGWGFRAPKKVWKVTRHISKTCPFCSFLMGCASRMAIHTTFDLKSNDWFLALAVLYCDYRTREPCPRLGKSDLTFLTPILQLKLCGNGGMGTSPFSGSELWENTHLILPVQAYDYRHSEVSDTIDWEVIKEWLDTCQAEHLNGYCNDGISVTVKDILSFCLIDCETEMIIPAAEISHPNYVTLSYVWGASTTSPQVLDASTSLPVLPDSNQRPKVVNDAMEVVQRIGYRYLWVDRYCIPQSDHDAKSIQIQKMGKIYSLSALTIIAAAGNDAEYGLPGVSSPPTLQPLWTTIRSGKREMPVIYFEPPNKDILRSTWNSRGWTYQEALLSRRRLVFTDRHVYFQCESMQSIGRLPSRHPDELPFPADGAVFPFRRYYGTSLWDEDFIWDLINEYAKRTLSFEQDSIHAVQGILDSFRDKCDVFFFYGVPILDFSYIFCDLVDYQNDSTMPNVLTITAGTFWEVDYNIQGIFRSLLWRDNWWHATVATHLTQETMFSDKIELRKKGFPSWTWAGWETAKNKVTVKGELNTAYYVPEGFLFEIRVSYDGKSLDWLRDNQEIRRRSENISEFPDFLIIRGPVFDASISCTDAEDQRITSHPTGPIVWKYTSPPFLASRTYRGPPFSVKEVRGHTIDLVAICVFSNIRKHDFDLHMLMLRSVGEDAHGQIYERLTCKEVHSWLKPYLSIEDINLRQMELRIR